MFVSRRQSAGLIQGGFRLDGSWSGTVWIDHRVQYFSLAVIMNDPILSGLNSTHVLAHGSVDQKSGSSGSPRAEVKILDVLGY